MRALNLFMNLLKDGKWHSLSEISHKSGLHESKLEMVVNFLAEYDFIELDKAGKTRLAQSVLSFLKKIGRLEEDAHETS